MRHNLLAAYIILTIFIGIGFFVVSNILDEQEKISAQQTHQNCVAVNESKRLVIHVLQLLAQPREDDGPGDFERRQRLFEEATEDIELTDCPPAPE